jgi:hypothetical protein
MKALLVVILLLTQLALADPGTCPQTSADWGKWRTQAISQLQTPFDIASGAFDLLNSCQGERDQQKFFKSPAFLACMAPLQVASQTVKLFKKDDVLNTAIFLDAPQSSRTPMDRPEVEALPDVFKSKDFVDASTNANLTEQQVSALMAKVRASYPDATIARFKSRFGIGDKSILIRIPGPQVDRWVHMIWDETGLGSFIFMIGVEKEDATGKKLNPPKSFFNSFTNISFSPESADPTPPTPTVVTAPTTDVIAPKNPHQNMMKGVKITATTQRPLRVSTPQASCFACHRTGPMPIVPATDSDPISYTGTKSAADAINEFNEAIANTASATPRNVNLDQLGPPLGEVNLPSRTDDFVKSCFNSSNAAPESVSRVKQAMNCMGCHNGNNAGKLTFPIGVDNTTEPFTPAKVFNQMIMSGHMPLGSGSQLSVDERSALAACLMKEFYGGFQSLVPGSAPGTYIKSLTSTKCPADMLNEETNSSAHEKQGSDGVLPTAPSHDTTAAPAQ